MKASDVRQKSDKELQAAAQELEEQLFRLRFQRNTGQLKATADIRKAKRDLARVRTIMREQQRAARKEAQ